MHRQQHSWFSKPPRFKARHPWIGPIGLPCCYEQETSPSAQPHLTRSSPSHPHLPFHPLTLKPNNPHLYPLRHEPPGFYGVVNLHPSVGPAYVALCSRVLHLSGGIKIEVDDLCFGMQDWETNRPDK
jgi:hypothetical protein